MVSVVLATYNWSSVLRHAIRSALWQTYPNLELIVVGDACTDDSEQVVASFGDERVRWLNLPTNSGAQSGPNNAGIEAARGELIAYLGHDDVWHPTHLAILVDAVTRAGADLGWALAEVIGPRGSRIRRLGGHNPRGGREIGQHIAPSSMLHRAELPERIGGWRHYSDILDPPDVEFVDRAQRLGARLTHVNALTVFKFPSGLRPNSYVERPDHEQAAYMYRIRGERGFIMRELAALTFRRMLPLAVRAPSYEPPPNHEPGWLVKKARRVRGLD
jgi:glycosyltransferase involved in cell wall biosynthesis